jgi:geranylgeranyl diphosphate synthase, type I
MPSLQQIVKTAKSKKTGQAKKNLNLFIPKINKKLEKYFDQEIKHAFGVSPKERELTIHLWEHIKEHCLRPAKRLRGSFIYYGYLLLGGKDEKAIMDAALSIELIHTALLMHDDFMDEDDIRRGKPTTHKFYETIHKKNNYKNNAAHYGHSMAIDAGDTALLAGFEVLTHANFPNKNKIEGITRQLRGIINTAFGQAFDITLESQGKATDQDIFDLHLAKTAIYTYENPLHIGAILAGAQKDDLKLLSQYALPAGIAFQLQDDILGLFGNPEKTGKSDDSDIREGKMTLLYTQVLKRSNLKQKQIVSSLWGKKDLTKKEASLVKKIVISTGSLEYSKKTSIKHAQKAQSFIPKMIAKGWNKKAIGYLDGIAQYMIERDI